ncbi:Rieske (2Fe-2S) protein [Paenibacillus alginolyticus]|uniref:Rieske (2Fe-2S) protein n=1 Tax=Paenibacillus alginolyticus TaxID=59839 RepID=A0ABT4GPM5_9BACL|nr:Rieske (2Fe-2S) protein [Paenibacillus alginolyticus]MCY9698175.1 Rieske (2Fe-2S) protein [Paenibacillus alginolyticus]MEC0146721.1 Rieske (2Fe-2S) protein [Paenibacillus alginolyticus]
MATHFVTDLISMADGQHVIVNVEGRSIGLYRINGEYYALHNRCPHEGAQLCKGKVCGTTLPSDVYAYQFGRQGEIVRCPWHGWEFDIKTGKSLVDEKVRVRSYKVTVEDGKVGIVI